MLREPTDLVILEGVEGAGKTTAARELVGRGWGYVHSSHLLRGDQVQQWFQEIGEAAAQSRAGQVVVDRMHVSTQVYGPLLRGHCSLSNFDLWAVEGWLTARGAEVRWLMPRDAAHTAEAVARRFRGMVTPRAIEVGFFRVLALTELPWRVWRESELLHERPLREPVTDEGAGSQAPRYWLLGLQHNLSPRAQRGHRWGSSFATGCGVHLYYALQVAGLGWSDLHLSNAYDDAGAAEGPAGEVAAAGGAAGGGDGRGGREGGGRVRPAVHAD